MSLKFFEAICLLPGCAEAQQTVVSSIPAEVFIPALASPHRSLLHPRLPFTETYDALR